MERITDGVHLLRSTRGSYAYVVEGLEPVLVDTSLPGRAQAMLQELQAWGGSIRHILVTHYDVDHIGNLAPLAAALEASVWLPAQDVPCILGEKPRPGIKRLIGAMIRPPVPVRFRPVTSGMQIGPLQAVASPGHTPGHMAYQGGQCLLVGDALRTREGRVVASPAILSWDRGVEAESRRQLLHGFDGWIFPAHGEPLRWTQEE